MKVSVSVDEEKLRRAQAEAGEEGASRSANLCRAVEHVLDARARLEAALEVYGPYGWPTAGERRKILEYWSTRATDERS